MKNLGAIVAAALSLVVLPAAATPFFFSNGNVDGRIGTASRPSTGGLLEIESADDFILSGTTILNGATFTGLLPGGVTVGEVRVEIYRVFPNDSTNPPSGKVPTRANSPSDVEFDDRDTASANLTFTTTNLGSFSVGNTVINGINPIPNQTTGGEGPATGQEILFDVNFTTPFVLPADHYFFVPQVEVSAGTFLWLSSVRPIVAPGTPFAPDLQSWIRNENLAPDWLRIGTDIVGPPPGGGAAPTFNAAFTLRGQTVPEPNTVALLGLALATLTLLRRRT